jgi:hypothetical protein
MSVELCEGSGIRIFGGRRNYNGTQGFCEWCRSFVPIVNDSNPYRPAQLADHEASE